VTRCIRICDVTHVYVSRVTQHTQMYIYIYIYVFIFTHTHMYIYIYSYLHTHAMAGVKSFVLPKHNPAARLHYHQTSCIYSCVYVYTCMYTHKHTCIYVYTHTYIFICMCAYTHDSRYADNIKLHEQLILLLDCGTIKHSVYTPVHTSIHVYTHTHAHTHIHILIHI